MKIHQIKVGRTYRKKGRCEAALRTVQGIEEFYRLGVILWCDSRGRRGAHSLRDFARWAGSEVKQ